MLKISFFIKKFEIIRLLYCFNEQFYAFLLLFKLMSFLNYWTSNELILKRFHDLHSLLVSGTICIGKTSLLILESAVGKRMRGASGSCDGRLGCSSGVEEQPRGRFSHTQSQLRRTSFQPLLKPMVGLFQEASELAVNWHLLRYF